MSIFTGTTKYNILDLGFNKSLTKSLLGLQGTDETTPELANVFTQGTAPRTLIAGELITVLEQQAGVVFTGKTGFNNSDSGYRLGIDTDDLAKFYIGDATNYFNWTGSALNIVGAITASSGTIGGWTIGATTITGGGVTLDSTGGITISSGGTNYLVVDDTGLQALVTKGGNSADIVLESTGLVVFSGNDKVGTACQIALLATNAASAAGILLSINKSVASATNNSIEFLLTSANASGNTAYISYNGTSGNNATGYALSIAQGAYTTNSALNIAQSGTGSHLSLNSLSSNPTTLLTAGDLAIVNNILESYQGSYWTKVAGDEIFGDGSDGDVTISGNTTLTADKYYNNLTINANVTLNTGGYRIFVKNRLATNVTNGIISRNGNTGGHATNGSNGVTNGTALPEAAGGTGGTAGAALAAGTLLGSSAGTAGVDGGIGRGRFASGSGQNGGNAPGSANNGTAVSHSLGVSGQTGQNGGNGGATQSASGGAYGTGGTAGTATAALSPARNIVNAITGLDWDGVTPYQYTSSAPDGGAGGSGGGGAYAGPGPTDEGKSGGGGGSGGSGSPGGIVFIAAKIIDNQGVISANGGAGGNGGNGGNGAVVATAGAAGGGSGSGGHGGCGGVVICIYNTLTGNTPVATGGAGGNVGTIGAKAQGGGVVAYEGSPGNGGLTGNTGTVITIQV